MLTFSEILGHRQVKTHFINAIRLKKVSHAYILSGEKGMGRKTLANAFALELLCEHKEDDMRPCMKCHACKQVLSGNHPDLIYVTHEKPASIGVDDIRIQINDTILVRPYSSEYKIYIVDESEKMTQQAQNALLKTIEEPPGYAVILLLSVNQEAFLPTILSRCVQLKLKPLQDAVVKRYLTEQLGVSSESADVYAAFARGNLGKAITISSSEQFQETYRDLLHIAADIRMMDISQILDKIRKMKENQMNLEDCLDFMEMWYRDVLLNKATGDKENLIFKNEYSTLHQISENSSYAGIEKILDAIARTRIRLNANVNMELAMELMLLVMKEN